MEYDTKSRKRIINFRGFLLIIICMILAIAFARLYFISLIFSVVLLIILIAMLSFYLIRQRQNIDGGIFKDRAVKYIALIVAIVLSLFTYIFYIVEVSNWHPPKFENEKIYSVSGKLAYNTVRNGDRTIIIDDITLNGDSFKGRVRIYLKEEAGKMEFAKEGDIIEFTSLIKSTDIYTNYRSNQRYYASVSQQDITLTFAKPDFLQSVRIKIKKALTDNLDENIAEISYSMLTGDKNTLPMETADYFRASGLAHILAVSGLHIGFLTAVLMWILRKVRAKRSVIFFVVLGFLLGYVFIADFSPSVIRAALMGAVGLFSMLRGKQRDGLNNLSFAAMLILLFKPLYLFDIGFLMSVFAVLGIIFFVSPISKTLLKIRFPRFLASGIAVPLSAQLGVLPVSIYFFRSLSVYSLIANILLMYVIMSTFILLIIGVAFTVFLPFMGFIIKIAGLGMSLIDEMARLIASLPLARFIIFSILPIFVCYVIYFVASRFVRKEKLSKIISLACMAVCALIIALGNYSYDIKNIITPVRTEFYDVTSIVTVDENIFVVGDVSSSSDVLNALIAVRARRVDAVFVNNLSDKTAKQLVDLQYVYNDFIVYFPMTENMSGLYRLLDKIEVIGFEDGLEIESGIFAEFANQRFLCYRLENEITALFFGISADSAKASDDLLNSADVVRSYAYVFSAGSSSRQFVNSAADDNDTSIAMESRRKYIIYHYKSKKSKTVLL